MLRPPARRRQPDVRRLVLGRRRRGPRSRCRPAPPLDRSDRAASPNIVVEAGARRRSSPRRRCARPGARRDDAGRTGPRPRRAPARVHLPAARQARRRWPRPSTMPAMTRVFVVTDVNRERHGSGRRGLSRAVPGRGRRRRSDSSPRSAPARRCIAASPRPGRPPASRSTPSMSIAMDTAHPGRHVPRRARCLPARHRCGARRRRCAGPIAATDRVRPRALAAPRHPAPARAASKRRRRKA